MTVLLAKIKNTGIHAEVDLALITLNHGSVGTPYGNAKKANECESRPQKTNLS